MIGRSEVRAQLSNALSIRSKRRMKECPLFYARPLWLEVFRLTEGFWTGGCPFADDRMLISLGDNTTSNRPAICRK